MLVRPAALLCLDEPTNHLDLASREVLEDALAVFPGTIVFISHDRYFINRIATSVLHVAHGVLRRYLGTYDDFLSASQTLAPGPGERVGAGDHGAGLRGTGGRRSTDAPRAVGRPGTGSAAPTRAPGPAVGGGHREKSDARAKPRPSSEVRELRRRLEAVEKRVHQMEARLAEITSALTDPALYADGERARAVVHERKSAEEQLAWLMREWEEISTALAAHE
jgi:ATP-binding cassette subfamily F protein 3